MPMAVIYTSVALGVDSFIRLLNYLSYRSGVDLDYSQNSGNETYYRTLFDFIDNIYFCVKRDLGEVELYVNKDYYKRGVKNCHETSFIHQKRISFCKRGDGH